MDGHEAGRTMGGAAPPCTTHENNCAQDDDDDDDDDDEDDDDDDDGLYVMLLRFETRCAPFINDAATLQNGNQHPHTLREIRAVACAKNHNARAIHTVKGCAWMMAS
jgi:hypothetical protein